MLKNYVDSSNLNYFRSKIVATEIVDSTADYMKAAGLALPGVTYYSKSGDTYTQVTVVSNETKVDDYYVKAVANTNSYSSSPSIRGVVDYVSNELTDFSNQIDNRIDQKIGQAMAASY